MNSTVNNQFEALISIPQTNRFAGSGLRKHCRRNNLSKSSFIPIASNQVWLSNQKQAKRPKLQKLEKIFFAQYLRKKMKKPLTMKYILKTYQKLPKKIKKSIHDQVLSFERMNTKRILKRLVPITKTDLISKAFTPSESQQPAVFVIRNKQIRKMIQVKQKIGRTYIQTTNYIKFQILRQPKCKTIIHQFQKEFLQKNGYGIPRDLLNTILSKTLSNFPKETKAYLKKKLPSLRSRRKNIVTTIFQNLMPIKRSLLETDYPLDQLRRLKFQLNKRAIKDYGVHERKEARKLRAIKEK